MATILRAAKSASLQTKPTVLRAVLSDREYGIRGIEIAI
jgi:hypothetical protein